MKRKIKIVYIISGLGIGGAQVLLINLLEEFKKYDLFDISVITLNSGVYVKDAERLGYKVYNLSFKKLVNPLIFFKLISLLRQIKPDIVHTHLLKADFYGRISARIVGVKKIVTTYHTNSSSHTVNETGGKQFTDYLDNFAVKFSSSNIIAVSEKVKEYLLHRINRVPGDLTVISNGINVDDNKILTEQEKTSLKNQFGIRDNDYVITFIGRLEQHKGVDFLIKSISGFLKNNINVKLLLIGSGNLESQIKEYVSGNNLSSNVKLIGFKDSVGSYIQISNLIVVPSVVEGFGIVILESMLNKVLVLASDAGAIPEIIKNNVNGFIFKTNDATSFEASLSKIYSKNDNDDIINNAYKYVIDNFNINVVAKKYAEYYEYLFNK